MSDEVILSPQEEADIKAMNADLASADAGEGVSQAEIDAEIARNKDKEDAEKFADLCAAVEQGMSRWQHWDRVGPAEIVAAAAAITQARAIRVAIEELREDMMAASAAHIENIECVEHVTDCATGRILHGV